MRSCLLVIAFLIVCSVFGGVEGFFIGVAALCLMIYFIGGS